MIKRTFPFEAIKGFSFKKVPIVIPADFRPARKIALIVLFLFLNCKFATSSLLKIQLLNWAIKTKELKKWLLDQKSKNDEFVLTLKVIHLDPTINRAVEFAIAERLISLADSGKLKITERGEKFAKGILLDDSIFIEEKVFLKSLGKSISEIKIPKLILE